ncbi:MAG: hypothetical protein AAFQ78_02860, partial [Bacteroidota bacterium]
MSSNSGGISKLIIKAYADEQFSSQKEEFEASINPEDITITSGVDYSVARSMGTAGGSLMYSTSVPRQLHFTLHFDETGVMIGQEKSVVEQTEQLKKVIYDYQENIHSPYYIRVIWGVIDFKGRLSGLDLRYTMFGANGKPIRSHADITVVEDVETHSNPSRSKARESSTSTGSAYRNTAGGESSSSGVAGSAAGAAARGGGAAAASNAASDGTGGAAAASNAASDSTGGGTSSNAARSTGETTDGAAAQSSATGREEAPSGQGTSASGESTAGSDDASADQPTTQSGTDPQNQSTTQGEKTTDQEGSPTSDSATSSPKAASGVEDKPSAPGEVYETKAGDTPASIANEKYGDPSKGVDIAALNKLPSSLAQLPAGLKLSLPFSLSALAAALLGGLFKDLSKALAWLKKKGKQAYKKGKEGATKAEKFASKDAKKAKDGL